MEWDSGLTPSSWWNSTNVLDTVHSLRIHRWKTKFSQNSPQFLEILRTIRRPTNKTQHSLHCTEMSTDWRTDPRQGGGSERGWVWGAWSSPVNTHGGWESRSYVFFFWTSQQCCELHTMIRTFQMMKQQGLESAYQCLPENKDDSNAIPWFKDVAKEGIWLRPAGPESQHKWSKRLKPTVFQAVVNRFLKIPGVLWEALGVVKSLGMSVLAKKTIHYPTSLCPGLTQSRWQVRHS